jgi:flagellar biosynthesis/type III secretory pathway protein FliH
MNIRNLKKAFSISLIALVFGFAAVGVSNAEYDRQNNNNQQNGRFRVKHGNYRTDQQGVDLLQQAINEGYRQGYQVGQQDRSNRRKSNWKRNNIYRSGDMGYNSHVERSQYQYYFQQGFQRGFDDGYNSRNRYGSNNSVLGNILNLLLNPRPY